MATACDDLSAEKASLVGLVDELNDAAWETPTAAEPWTIHDQVSHLAYFDQKALLAHRDPEVFMAELRDSSATNIIERQIEWGRSMAPQRLLQVWDEANRALTAEFRDVDPKTQVAWYGPPMSARSKLTARIMETWAHGQDIADALGVARKPTSRLHYVCHIGVRARPFAYIANGRMPSDTSVYVALQAPNGQLWEWGDEDSSERVTGSALGFALLVTQRRHRSDVDVHAEGEVADEWLDIAQAFAGPPGAGRAPGQFAHLDGSP